MNFNASAELNQLAVDAVAAAAELCPAAHRFHGPADDDNEIQVGPELSACNCLSSTHKSRRMQDIDYFARIWAHTFFWHLTNLMLALHSVMFFRFRSEIVRQILGNIATDLIPRSVTAFSDKAQVYLCCRLSRFVTVCHATVSQVETDRIESPTVTQKCLFPTVTKLCSCISYLIFSWTFRESNDSKTLHQIEN